MISFRRSRLALVVVKLKIADDACYLMRKDPSWHDITFIGGHANERDAGVLQRAAHRELLEEVPPLRTRRNFALRELTAELQHGPVYSLSANTNVVYDLQFFHLMFQDTPEEVVTALGRRSRNVLVAERDLLSPNRYKVAALVQVLNTSYDGGLPSVPYSWSDDLYRLATSVVAQSDLAFG